ncbi:MAG: lipase maturation factor family protein [Chlamydiota bacterium]|nr:lipase maturation factor family protein [Chlamydiota bacterium]
MYHPENYLLASKIFIRTLGVIYFIAFFPFLFQIKGLIGSNGILPLKKYLTLIKSRFGNLAYWRFPCIFWLNASDVMLISVVLAGLACSLLLTLGLYPLILLPILYILYLSIIKAGQDFLSFGWELFLMEITVNAFLLSLTNTPNPFVWISINFLLFRFHLQAGAVKLQSGDINWRNLTALKYHYQTQPIANTQAWYAHKLPLSFHKLSCLLMFIIELVIPFGVFGGEELRLGVYICFVGLQLMIWFTGNFSYLNHMTIAFCTILLSDNYLSPLFGHLNAPEPSHWLLSLTASTGGIILFTLQLMNVWSHFLQISLFDKLLKKIYHLHIVNRYGIFAVMTTHRYEIVIQGSDDGIHWHEYSFKHKASETNRRPKRISPYQPRIDWQIWFLPFSSYDYEVWFQNFLLRLLQGEKHVLTLLGKNPFPNTPPQYIRALKYEYVFSDAKTKKTSGNWWIRTYIGEYSPTLSLKTCFKR